MTTFEWTRSGRDWIGIYGKYRAIVRERTGPLLFSHWFIEGGGGSGGTSSIRGSKRAAEEALEHQLKRDRKYGS